MSSITSGKYFLLAISSTQINKDFYHSEIEPGIKNTEPELFDAFMETEFLRDTLSSTQHIDSYSQPHSPIGDHKISNKYLNDAIPTVTGEHSHGMPSIAGWQMGEYT